MTASTALLVVGYVLAVPFSVFLPGYLRMWRGRDVRLLAVELTGTALVVAGWALKGGWGAVAFNSLWFVGLTTAWVVRARREDSVSAAR